MNRKTIEAVVEVGLFEDKPPWPLSSAQPFSFVRLHSDITLEEIGTLMLVACTYGEEKAPSSVKTGLERLLAKEMFLLPGGLQFLEDGLVKVTPGCCAGLENWRDWLGVSSMQNKIWAGHDPEPWVEYFEGGIRIWQDKKKDASFIEMTFEEIESSLEKVQADLRGFLVQLNQWGKSIAAGFEHRIVDFFAKHLRT